MRKDSVLQTITGTEYFAKSKKIKQNWSGPENFEDVCISFDHFCQK